MCSIDFAALPQGICKHRPPYPVSRLKRDGAPETGSGLPGRTMCAFGFGQRGPCFTVVGIDNEGGTECEPGPGVIPGVEPVISNPEHLIEIVDLRLVAEGGLR
ncbi:hypothetical protein J2849_000622 [Azospirillum melinis]|nr:hypothetical protein [Azospirillum melinis]